MHRVLIAAAWIVAGPPATEPTLDARTDAIGIVWHDQATVTSASRQRLVDAASEEGRVVAEPLVRARAAAALSLERARSEQLDAWIAGFESATTAYRSGEIDRARQALSSLVDAIRADPAVPGATRLLWRVHMLRGQLAWAEGDAEQRDAALVAAVVLDPAARPSTREVPPPVVEAYTKLHDEILARRDQWSPLEVIVEGEDLSFVEIDGVPGTRVVPDGEHVVVLRRPGVPPRAAMVEVGQAWTVPASSERLGLGLPEDEATAQEICDLAGLDWLVLARVRGPRLGVQRFACGEGFAPPWFEGSAGWEPAVAELTQTPEEGWTALPVLHRDGPWPSVPSRPFIALDGGGPPRPGSRLRRAAPWLVVTGTIVGVVTYVVLRAGGAGADLAIDGNGFFGR